MIGQIRRRMMMGGSTKPYDAEVEYLVSTGNQCVKTGIVYNGRDSMEMKASFFLKSSPQDQNSATFAGGRIAYNNRGFQVGTFGNGTFMYGNTLYHDRGISSAYTDYTITFINGVLRINGVLKNTIGLYSYTTPEIYLFCNNENGRISENLTGRIYYYKLYDDAGNYKCDFIPVRKNGIGYMYDKVSGQLFGNQGRGQFIIGPDK